MLSVDKNPSYKFRPGSHPPQLRPSPVAASTPSPILMDFESEFRTGMAMAVIRPVIRP